MVAGTYTFQNLYTLYDPVIGIMDGPAGGIIEIGAGLFFIGIGILPDILFNSFKETLRVRKRILVCGIVILATFIGVLTCDYQIPIVEVYEGVVVDIDGTEVQLEDGKSIIVEYPSGIHRGHEYRFYLKRTRILSIKKPVRYEEI